MERIASLYNELPRRKHAVTQARSKVLKETENPFGADEGDETQSASADSSRSPSSVVPERGGHGASSSLGGSKPAGSAQSFLSTSKDSKKKKDKNTKKKHKSFNLEAEKEQMKSKIAEASIAATNLMNTLQSINREQERISNNQAAVQRFEACKQLRRQILRYIHHIESEQWLGSLLHANDELVTALMTYEQLDRSIDADSDSDDELAEQVHLYRLAAEKGKGKEPSSPTIADAPAARMASEASSVRSSQAVAEVAGGRVVPKPMPQSHVDDARAYQIEQLRRRFSPKESPVANGGTLLAFPISPSDPDFPFELDKLHCELTVPARYPAQSPKLQVKNADVPRGFAINIEKGWDKLVTERPAATLLALVHALDRSLEAFLSEQKAETVKLTLFKDNRHLDAQRSVKKQVDEAKKPHIPEESFSKEQIAEAKAKRSQEVRQLEARMSRLPLYQQSCDGIVYTLPLEPRRRAQLPAGLQAVKSVQLIIPYLYPLQSIRFLLNDVESKDAEAVEALFTKKSKEQAQMTLMSRLNYLVQNLHVLAQQVQKEAAEEAATSAAYRPTTSSAVEAKEGSDSADGERSHVHVIPRPPEWTLADGSGESGASEDEDDDEEDIDEDDGGGAPLNPPDTVRDRPSGLSQVPEKGTALTFPSVELHGIELLQVAVLGLRLKCSRCKTMNEMGGLRAGVEKQASCRKAGFIDTAACTLADLLPSTFVPTCAQCSTPSHGLVSVRGETTTNVCRECHSRFTFKIPDVKFLAYTPGSGALPPATGPRRRQEKLGLHAGEALPGRGACAHYRRSYRWFRFACCSKVYPCDRCHDEAADGDHALEWANRMICGWCSREQNYRVESCGFCGRSVIGRRGNGFWEGGKGTRNRVLMRRGDKRKHRRIGGGEAGSSKEG
ncbi:hypothetical protein P8C59_008913 [Phyllachora maydis]|uniref:CHY-type domain-containing protein n=1 Tax=Phyllachora maydis TaxID=1825666 RepID=A0AAD9MF26_9PEZI|nr:hypothetical protein P8C59_008913 [Phyllachora maydis]